MKTKIVSGMILTLLLTVMLASAFNIRPVKTEPRTIIVPDDYLTIQEAINNANEGDTIYVRAGMYYENVMVSKTVSLIGEDRNTTIVDGILSKPLYVTANGVTITGFKIRNSRMEYKYAGIVLDSVSFCNISWNILTDNFDGIYLEYSSNNTINNNIVSGNNWNGIHLKYYSNYNVIASNTILNNRNGMNIEVNSNNNYMLNNYIAESEWDGIDLMGSQNNSIKCNTITNCFTGMYLGSETDNMNIIYHNNLINNMYQVTCYSTPNMWDDGYPSGGNYWSDHVTVDDYSGINQDELGSDGIVDDPYIIDDYNRDDYPLVEPWSPLPTELEAIIDVSPDTLNLKSNGRWITAYIELPENYNVSDINRTTILLNDTIPVNSFWMRKPLKSVVGDYDADDISDLMVRFDRTEVIELIFNASLPDHRFTYVTLTITGLLTDETLFEGNDAIRVILHYYKHSSSKCRFMPI